MCGQGMGECCQRVTQKRANHASLQSCRSTRSAPGNLAGPVAQTSDQHDYQAPLDTRQELRLAPLRGTLAVPFRVVWKALVHRESLVEHLHRIDTLAHHKESHTHLDSPPWTLAVPFRFERRHNLAV